MKSTVFELKFPSNAPHRSENPDVKFSIPTLKAYAIEYSEFVFKGGFGEHKELVEGEGYTLVDDGLIWHGFYEPRLPIMDYYKLVIHYHGIRDYALLFPHIKSNHLQRRLGQFYEESEVSFDNGAWLSFALMTGAIYESMLFDFGGGKKRTFSKLIAMGKKKGILDEFAAEVMNRTRELRNLVHAEQAKKPFVTRAEAMDMRKVLDRLIKQAVEWGAAGR